MGRFRPKTIETPLLLKGSIYFSDSKMGIGLFAMLTGYISFHKNIPSKKKHKKNII